VLLVEDAPGDVLLAKEAFEQSAISSQLHVTADGDQAIGFLRRTGPYASAPRPGLILLDLNLPRRGGLIKPASPAGNGKRSWTAASAPAIQAAPRIPPAPRTRPTDAAGTGVAAAPPLSFARSAPPARFWPPVTSSRP